MKLVVSYCYYPLEKLADEPLFCALLESVQLLQKNKNGEKQHIAELEQAVAAQQQTVALRTSRSPNCTRKTPRSPPAASPTRLPWKAC